MARSILFRIISAILAIAGIIVLLNSTAWGLMAYDVIVARVGGLSGDAVSVAIREPVVTYRVLGALLLGVGAYCALAPSRERV